MEQVPRLRELGYERHHAGYVNLFDVEKAMSASGCPHEGSRVLLIGDSLAHGLNSSMLTDARRCATAYASQTKIGLSATAVTSRWLAGVLEWFRPTIVLISLGGNDYQRRWAKQAALDAPGRIVRQCYEAGARQVIWIYPPDIDLEDAIGAVPSWVAAVGGSNVYPEDFDVPKESDGLHPTAAGYGEWGQRIWRWMSRRRAPKLPSMLASKLRRIAGGAAVIAAAATVAAVLIRKGSK